jgi:hypothetical protein
MPCDAYVAAELRTIASWFATSIRDACVGRAKLQMNVRCQAATTAAIRRHCFQRKPKRKEAEAVQCACAHVLPGNDIQVPAVKDHKKVKSKL